MSTTRMLRSSLLVVLLLAAGGAAAQDPGVLAARRARAVAASPLGETIQSSGIDYRVVRGVRAVQLKQGQSAASRLAEQGVAADALLEQKGPYVVYREGATAPAGASPGRAVVVDPRTGVLGIVTGMVVVKVGSQSEAEAMARATGIALEYYAESIGRAFFLVVPGGDAVAAAARLAARPGAGEVEVDVQVAFRVPM